MKFKGELKTAPVIIGVDHAISLGWQLRFVCDDKRIRSEFRASRQLADKFRDEFGGCRGLHVTWPHVRQAVIFIDGQDDGKVSTRRLLELMVHEVSHAVDFYFERAHITTVDTEFRAYYNDWICGQLFATIKTIE